MNQNNIALEKSEIFAVNIIFLYKNLVYNKKETVMSKQILKSGTSIGANLSEAVYAVSKEDLYNKIHISLKECEETRYWLRVLRKSLYITEDEFNSFYLSSNEIIKLLTASANTLAPQLKK